MKLEQFRKQSTSSFFRLFLLRKLPLAFIAGVRVVQLDEKACVTKMKFGWINQNPFKSMYFAAMQMAGELATGLLLYQYVASGHQFSMLLISIQADYFKKAVGTIFFSCNKSHEMDGFISELQKTDLGIQKTFTVIATNEAKEEVAKFEFTWSCKTK